MSLPELFSILEAYAKKLYEDRKFFAAIQGIDLEKNSSSSSSSKNQNGLERMRERIAKRTGKPLKDPDDITNLRGRRAKSKGFGIGMGLDYDIISADGTVTPG